MPDGVAASWPGARVTSTTATQREADAHDDLGRRDALERRSPTTTGTTAARTPVVGATTPIRPTASPR